MCRSSLHHDMSLLILIWVGIQQLYTSLLWTIPFQQAWVWVAQAVHEISWQRDDLGSISYKYPTLSEIQSIILLVWIIQAMKPSESSVLDEACHFWKQIDKLLYLALRLVTPSTVHLLQYWLGFKDKDSRSISERYIKLLSAVVGKQAKVCLGDGGNYFVRCRYQDSERAFWKGHGI